MTTRPYIGHSIAYTVPESASAEPNLRGYNALEPASAAAAICVDQ